MPSCIMVFVYFNIYFAIRLRLETLRQSERNISILYKYYYRARTRRHSKIYNKKYSKEVYYFEINTNHLFSGMSGQFQGGNEGLPDGVISRQP